MIKYYIKIALRNFRYNRIIFTGTLLTLVLGSLSISLLFLFMFNEFTRNDFHERKEDIYITVIKSSPESQWTGFTPNLFLGFNYNDYPEIETATNIQKYNEGDISINYKLNTQYPEGLVVDSTFFRVFDFDLKIGNKKEALSEPDAILISENLSVKLFGKENPIGKKVNIGTFMLDEYTVKGILEKTPPTSSISFEFILPNSHVPNQYAKSGMTFLMMKQGSNKELFTNKIKRLTDEHEQFKGSLLNIIPFKTVYFNELKVDFNTFFSAQGNKLTLYVLGIIALVIFIISAMNISNLQIINTNTSVKYIVLSVVNGAKKKHIIYQKLTELCLLICFSIILIIGTYQLVLPYFNNFTGINLSPSFFHIITLNIVIIVSLTFLALIYPIVIALNIPIIKSLQNRAFFTSRLMGKKSAIVAQYTLTFILLISSVVVVRQLDMMLDKDLGFKSHNIIRTKMFRELSIPINLIHNISKVSSQNTEQRKLALSSYDDRTQNQQKQYDLVKNELATQAAFANFSQGNSPLEVYPSPWKQKGKESEFIMQNTLTVKPGHETLFGFEVIEGRFFDENRDQPYSQKVVINEAAKDYLGIDIISDNKIKNKYWKSESGNGYEIIGVVKNFNYERLSLNPKPLIMVYFDSSKSDDFLIELGNGGTVKGLQILKKLFNEINPNETFKYSYITDEISLMYEKEKQLSVLYIIFTVLALFISTIGLFTIALYDTQRRVKEIGIRKVNGAKTQEILSMLNRDFTKYVFIAFLLACPLAYFLMDKWLENFAYKTNLSWWIFALSGIFTLFIALLTVSWQSYNAAKANPIKSLRTE